MKLIMNDIIICLYDIHTLFTYIYNEILFLILIIII